MRRDWGITIELLGHIPEDAVPILDILALPGDLLVIVGVLGMLSLLDIGRNVRESSAPLWSANLAFVVATVLGGLALVVALESLFGLPRPPAHWHRADASPYAFPSGHTMAATVCWGALAMWYIRPLRVSAIFSGILVISVGFARLALGLHYVPDILAGVGFGLGYLALAGYLADGSPRRAFAIALTIAVVALFSTGFGDRALLAFGGVLGATAAWAVLSTGFAEVRLAGRSSDRQ